MTVLASIIKAALAARCIARSERIVIESAVTKGNLCSIPVLGNDHPGDLPPYRRCLGSVIVDLRLVARLMRGTRRRSGSVMRRAVEGRAGQTRFIPNGLVRLRSVSHPHGERSPSA